MLLRLGIVMFILSLQRLLFFAFNFSSFNDISTWELLKVMVIGMRFDLAIAVIINAFFLLFSLLPFRFTAHRYYQTVIAYLFYITNSVMFAANCLDFIYFRFTLKRTTFDFFQYIAIGNDTTTLLPRFLADYWYILLIWIGLVALMVLLYRLTKVNKYDTEPVNWRFYLYNTALIIAFTIFFVYMGRGGFQLRPITIISAGESTDARNVPLVLNTPFTIVNTWNQKTLKKLDYFPKETCDKLFSPVHKFGANQHDFKPANVVVIILESFSKEHIGALNKDLDNGTYKGYTPFLDSLIGRSLVFVNCFANGKKSIEGIPAVLASVPGLMNTSYVSSIYAGNKLDALPALLKEKGYSSAFYHGGTNGTMRFDAFARMAGFDKYYGRYEYNNEADYDGNWGIWDEPFLQYFAMNLCAMKQPFCAGLFTLSSHHPFKVPAKYTGRFPKGSLDIHESIGYTDFALRRFFATASKMTWFDNTLFVITADHTSQAEHAYYKNNVGMYEVPLIFYMHNSTLSGFDSTVVQQTDIVPSVLDYLHYDKPFVSFGESVFDSVSPHFSISYLNNIYQLIRGPYALEFNGDKPLSLYDYRRDPELKQNLIGQGKREEVDMLNFTKALLQSYSDRMISNKLTAK
ncbi:MAG: LTA synthase family protein [Bacteroidota bacterium]